MTSPDLPCRTTVSEILALHGIPAGQICVAPDGHINRVALVDDRYVVRFSNHHTAEERLSREALLTNSLQGRVPVAEVLHYGRAGSEYYQVRACLPGRSLADVWPALPAPAKKSIVEQVVSILRALHQQRFSAYGYLCLPQPAELSWRQCKRAEFETIADDLRARTRLPVSFIDECRDYFSAASVSLDGTGPAVLVHNDLWLGNIIVDDTGVRGVIDFELAEKAPRDAEIFKIKHFCEKPYHYGKHGSFTDFFDMLSAEYPELFDAPQLGTRLRLYELISYWKSFQFELGCPDSAPDTRRLIAQTEQILTSGS